MSRTAVMAAFVFVVAGLSGCASPARVIRQDSTSVVVAIPDNTNSWPSYYQDEAKQAATACIQDPVLVTSRREKVGEQLTNTADTRQRSFGEVISSSTTAKSDNYEYHLEYRSNSPVHGPSTITRSSNSLPPSTGGPAASLSPRGAPDSADPVRPALPPLLPVTPPTSPATNMPNTALPGPGR